MRYFAVPSPKDELVILVSEEQAELARKLANDVAKQQNLSPQLLLVNVNKNLATLGSDKYTFDDGAQNPDKNDTGIRFETLDNSQREYMDTLEVLSAKEASAQSNSLIRKVAVVGLAVVATAAGVYAASAYGLFAAAVKFGSLYGAKIAIGGMATTAVAATAGGVMWGISKLKALKAIADSEKALAIELRKDEDKTADNTAEKALASKDKVVTFAAQNAKKNASKSEQPAPVVSQPRKGERQAAKKK